MYLLFDAVLQEEAVDPEPGGLRGRSAYGCESRSK